MGGVRRLWVALAVASAWLGSVGIMVVATATPSAALTCTDSWQGPTTGTTAWNALASNWSSGFPTSSDVVCINLAGTYTVDMTGSESINTLQLGGGATGTQTLEVDGSAGSNILSLAAASQVTSNGALALDPKTSGYAQVSGSGGLTIGSGGVLSTSGPAGGYPAYIETPLTNQTGGTVTIGAPDTRQDTATLSTNSGSFTVASGGKLALTGGASFTDAAGTLTVTGTMSETSGTFTQSGGTESGNPVTLASVTLADSTGTGLFNVIGSSTLTGTIPSGQTVSVTGSSGSVQLTVTGVTDDGTLALDPLTTGYADIIGSGAGLTIGSGGVLSTSGPSSGYPAYIETPLNNQASGTVTIGAPDTRQDTATLTTNSGSFTVASGGKLALTGGASFTDAAGTLTVTGTMSETSGTFTQSGGTESGNPVTLASVTLADSTGTGLFNVIGSSTLTGTIPSGQTVSVTGSSGSVQLTVTGVTDDGTLALDPLTTGYADISGSGAGLTIGSGGVLSTSAPSGSYPAYIETPLTNQASGTVTIGAPDTRQDTATLSTNSGSFTVASGGKLALTGGASFTDAAGTLTVTGTMSETSGTFTQSGGTESGNPVTLASVTLADSTGTGLFNVIGSSTLTGTIPSGQTVSVTGSSGSVQLTVTGVTDDGTLALDPLTTGYADIIGSGAGLTIGSGGVLSTSGPAGGYPAYIETPLTNKAGGTVTVGDLNTKQDSSTLTSNSGTVQITNGGNLALSGGGTLSDTATGTLGVTVNGTAASGGISGSGVTVTGSTLGVTTVGSPAVGSTFTPITGPVTGTFSKFAFGDAAYSVSYPSGSVLLTTGTPFTASPTSFPASANIPTGPVEVATIGSASEGTGSYSATVDYGDTSPTVVASVAISGNTGKVTAPSHTYTTPGAFTVTTSVSNTDGTTVTVTKNITVTGDQAGYSCIVSGFATKTFPVVFSESLQPPSSIDAGGTFATDLAARVTIPASVINHYVGLGATSLTVTSQSATEDGLTAGGAPSGAVSPSKESASATNLPQSDTALALNTPYTYSASFNPVTWQTGPGTGLVDFAPGALDGVATFVMPGSPTSVSIDCSPPHGVAALGSTTVKPPSATPAFQVPSPTPPFQSQVSAGTDGGWGMTVANTSKVPVTGLKASVSVSDGHAPLTYDLAGMAASSTVCSASGSGRITCSIGNLAAGASVTLNVLVNTGGLAQGTNIAGSASVTSANAGTHPTTLGDIGVVVVEGGNGTKAVATPGIALTSTKSSLSKAKATITLTLPKAKIKKADIRSELLGSPVLLAGTRSASPPPVAVTLEPLAPSAEPALCPPNGPFKCEGDVVQAVGNFSAYTSKVHPIVAVIKFFYGLHVPVGTLYMLKTNGKVDKLAACTKSASGYKTPCVSGKEVIGGSASHDSLYAQDTVYFSGSDPAMGRR